MLWLTVPSSLLFAYGSGLSNLASLKTLNLCYNSDLTGQVPDSLFSHPSLISLCLAGSITFPTSGGSSSKLQMLSVVRNPNAVEYLPAVVTNLKQLRSATCGRIHMGRWRALELWALSYPSHHPCAVTVLQFDMDSRILVLASGICRSRWRRCRSPRPSEGSPCSRSCASMEVGCLL